MSDKESFESLKEQSLTNLIQRELEDMMVRGDLVAGSRINEKQLAETLNVSRAPVREVTRALEQIGLVEIIRNRGAFVRNLDLKDVVAIFDIRMALARLAATVAARRMNAASAKSLESLIQRMDAVDNAEEYLPLNQEFHQQIFQLSDNPRLLRMELSLRKELRLYRLRSLRSGNSMQTSKDEHREILAALVDRNPELAGRLFEQHILAARDRFMTSVDRQEPTAPKRRGRPRKNGV